MMMEELHALWNDNVIQPELFYYRASTARGAWWSVVSDFSAFSKALAKLIRAKTKRVPTSTFVYKLFSPVINARFVDVDKIEEHCFGLTQILQEYDIDKEMIIISSYCLDGVIISTQMNTVKHMDIDDTLVEELQAANIGPTVHEVMAIYPNDTAEDLKKMANDVYDMIYSACAYCGARKKSLKSCAKCQAAKYCDKACQTASWIKGHKKHCKMMGKLASSLFKII